MLNIYKTNRIMIKTYRFLIISLCIFLFTNCQDNEVNDFYNKRVNLKVDITLQDNDLASSGSAKSITQPRLAGEYVGMGGLLLFRSSIPVDGFNNIMSLYAFDLACPVEKVASQKIKFIGDSKAKCDKCGTVYDLAVGVGNAIDKPSSPRLVVYPTYYLASDHVQFQVIKK